MKRFLAFCTVFGIGAAAYSLLEILWRGYTHWSMSLTGGVCFSVLFFLHVYAHHLPLSLRCVLGACAITAAEFLVGCTVNLWLGWNVWDYSGVPLNLCGQICLPYSLFWLILCALAAPICRRLGALVLREDGVHS